MQNKICLKFKCKLFIICTRRGTRQDPPKKVTTLHCAAAYAARLTSLDRHDLGSYATRAIVFCPWKKHLMALSSAWQAVLNFSHISGRILKIF